MPFHELLLNPSAYAPPAHILEDLSDTEAVRRVEGAPHSVAEIVAHMAFWQEWFLSRARGVATPMATPAAKGWPAAPPGSWKETREQFLRGAREAVSLGSHADRISQRVAPAIEFPPLAHYTVNDALTHVAIHNAHHLGQVVVLRQLLGRWPPPSGSWTW